MRLALRWYLLILVVLAVVPPILFSSWMGTWLRQDQHRALEQALGEASRAVAVSIEREMAESIESLHALALDRAVDRNDLRRLYRHARELVTAEGRWGDISVTDLSGQLLFSVASGFRRHLPSIGDRDYFQRVVRTGEPVVSDIDADVTSQQATVHLVVPVSRGGRLRYVIVASLRPVAWASIAAAREMHRDWAVTVSDGGRRYIALSRASGRIIGHALPEGLARGFDALPSGFGRFRLLEGDEAYVAWSSVRGTRWTAAVATVAKPIDAAGRRLALSTAGAGVIFTIGGAIVALLVAARIGTGVRKLASSAAAIGRGEQPETFKSGVAELDEVSVALSTAGRQRAESDAALQAAEARARAHAEQAEEATRAKDAFLAMLSHELRTPLTAILGWTRVLSSAELDTDARRHAVDTIDRNVQLQVKLIDDLLDVSRIVTGNLRLERRRVNVGRIVVGALETIRPAAALKHIELVERIDPACGTVNADAGRLEQVVSNLLANAIKFTPEGGRVTVGLGSGGEEVILTVSDTGEGIDADFLPHVFDRFRQAEHTINRAAGGLGLGLAIVRYLVEAHGGTVGAASAGRGRGATFTVRLPGAQLDDATGG